MTGTVTQSTNGKLHIRIVCNSACMHCQLNNPHRSSKSPSKMDSGGLCGFAESEEKEIVVETADWKQYTIGDNVEVDICDSQGLMAVLIAYLLPAAIGITILIATYKPLGELCSALVTLLFFGLYIIALRLLRRGLQRRFTYTIRHC